MAQNDYSFLPFGAGGIPANENSGTSLTAPRWYSGTAAPTSGTYNLGDVCYNVSPLAQTTQAGTILAWVCTTAGTPGTWATINAPTSVAVQTTTATSGTLTNGQRLILLNPATTGTYSLPEASGDFAGFSMTVKNIGTGLTTLTPLASDYYEGGTVAAITLTPQQAVKIITNGTTNWYNETFDQLPVLTTTATSGTLANGQRLILLNPATTGTYSLPEASANYAGFQMTIKSLASGSITLTPLASDQYDKGVAAITLAQYSVANLITDSTTNWYKAS